MGQLGPIVSLPAWDLLGVVRQLEYWWSFMSPIPYLLEVPFQGDPPQEKEQGTRSHQIPLQRGQMQPETPQMGIVALTSCTQSSPPIPPRSLAPVSLHPRYTLLYKEAQTNQDHSVFRSHPKVNSQLMARMKKNTSDELLADHQERCLCLPSLLHLFVIFCNKSG